MFDKVKKMAEGASLNTALDKIKSVGEVKSAIIGKVVSVDYEPVIVHLQENSRSYPRTELLLATVETLQQASLVYKASESPGRDGEFMLFLLSSIEPEKVIDELEPVAAFIPMGSLILMILRLLLKYKRSA